ncbi:MAG TPA: hypothetical protein VGH75_10980 [Steroidobacteraceae bacterium]
MPDFPGRPRLRAPALFVLLVAVASAAPAREDQILILGNPAGMQTATRQGGTARAEYSFNDRGRGDHIIATWKLDAAGVLTEYRASGNDYVKAAVTETFSITRGRASWRSRAEQGDAAVTGEAFYVPVTGPPEMLGVLARALLKAPEHRLALLPAGEATIEAVGPLPQDASAGVARAIIQYQISGLDFSPAHIWLDQDGETVAIVSNWLSLLSPAAHSLLTRLLAAQQQASDAWSARLAREQTVVPQGDVVIRNARLFDPRDLSVTGGTSVLIRGERIVQVAEDTAVAAQPEARVIEARGRFLMPGLWDNHQHFGDNVGVLDLLNGVTSARDMANDIDEFLERIGRFEAGTELGPRVFRSGIIDGEGPFAGPTKMRISTAADATRDVDWYADHGYGQIKIYSSVPPAIVPLIAAEAHARGMRVSGHVPHS